MVAAVVLAVSATAVTQAVTAAAASRRAAQQDRVALEMAESLADEVAAMPFDPSAAIAHAERGAVAVTIDGVEYRAHAGVGHEGYTPHADPAGAEAASLVPPVLGLARDALARAREVAGNGIDYARTPLGVLGRKVNDSPTSNSLHGLADVTVEGGEQFARVILVQRHEALPGAAVATARVASPSGRTVSARRLIVPKD